MRESSTEKGKSEDRAVNNLATQLSLVPNMNPTNLIGTPRHSSWNKNAKEDYQVAERGNNAHDASCTAIVTVKETPSVKQRSVPNVGTLLQKTKQGKADFQLVAEKMRQNSIAQEERIKSHHSQKWVLIEDQLNHMKKTDERKGTIIDRHVDYKIKK